MSEKFDFSKIEDRNKFEKLPEKERREIIDIAQEEAMSVNEAFEEKKQTDLRKFPKNDAVKEIEVQKRKNFLVKQGFSKKFTDNIK